MNTSVKRLPIYALLLVLGVLGALIIVLAATPGQQAQAAGEPIFRLPFPKYQTWTSHTYYGHNPLYATDLNRGAGYDDFGDTVVASAAGKVITSTYIRPSPSDPQTYGNYIKISHPDGTPNTWHTLYAHLSKRCVSVGDKVEKGDKIGEVGASGGDVGSHLHYEQYHNGNVRKIQLGSDREEIRYFGDQDITSHNRIGGSSSC